MKTKVLGAIILVLLILPASVSAHSGRTDSSGGHNCNVGACAGTYHYHNGGGSYTPPPPPQPVTTTETVAETETIYFKTVEQNDEELPVGKRKTTREGVNGVNTHTYNITYTDGVQTGRDLISSVVTKDQVSKVVAVGTKAEPVVAASAPNTKTSDETSAGAAIGGLAVVSAVGYGLYRLGKFGATKIKRN